MLKPIILKNGLTILRYPHSGANSFVVGFATKTGSAVELSTGYPQGITSLIERLFWAGTDKHPNQRNLHTTLEGMGGSFYSSTTPELLELAITVPFYNQFKAISFMSEIVQRSLFDERDIQKEKNTILQLLRDQKPSFESEITTASLSALYPESSLAYPLEGSVDSIMNINSETILHYLNQQIHPEKSFLILAGNFDNRPCLELSEQEWSFWAPRGKGYVDPHSLNHQQESNLPQFAGLQRGSQNTTLSISFAYIGGFSIQTNEEGNPLESVDSFRKKTATLLLLNTILGKGYSSRLWQKSVEEEAFFLQIRTDLIRFKNLGHLQISGIVENTQFMFGLESILSILETLRKTTVSINELTKSKEFLKGSLILQHEDIATSALWQAEYTITSGDDLELKNLLEIIESITAAEIRALAHDIFTPQKVSIVSLGTSKEPRLIEKLLYKYLAS